MIISKWQKNGTHRVFQIVVFCFFWIASFLAMTAARIVIARNEAIQDT